MKFTDEQNNALSSGGKVLVSAAAGSGKTAVLVQKIINMITDENSPIDIDNLLVVTFTKDAAAEMKSRISKSLTDLIRQNPNNQNLKRQKLLLSGAHISTTDSLCKSLAQEYFYKLSIPADFRIVEQSAMNTIKDDCVTGILTEEFEKSDPDFIKLVRLFGGESASEALKFNILKVYEYVSTLPFPHVYLDKIRKLYLEFDEKSELFDVLFDYSYELLKNTYTIFQKHYEDLVAEPDLAKFYGDSCSQTLGSLRTALDLVEKRDYKAVCEFVCSHTSARIGNARGYSDEIFKKRIQNARTSAEDVIKKDLHKLFLLPYDRVVADVEALTPLVLKFLELIEKFIKEFDVIKKEKNAFRFDDIEIEVLKLLVKENDGKIEYTDEAKELSRRYKYVMVDEYQDTNDLQNVIFTALSDGGKNLFMVGDVKQSIYGFRKANPRIFLSLRDELPHYTKGATASKVIMSGNFRSAPEICDFVNFAFYRLLSKECGEMYYEQDDCLVPKKEFCKVQDTRVNLDVLQTCSDEHSKAQHQAHHVARKIKKIVAGDECISVDNTKRKATFSDFAILFRDRKQLPEFIKVLQEYGIPYITDDAGNLFEEKEIINLLSLLQVIDNPYSDIPLATLLTSDIYNFTSEDIAKIRSKHNGIELFSSLNLVEKEDEKVKAFLDEIREFKRISTVSSVSKLIGEVLQKTGYYNTVHFYENGAAAFSNLLIFKNIAKTFEETTARGLSSFLGYIKHAKQNSKEYSSALPSKNEDAVILSTMHKSKGLQFPICFLVGLETAFKIGNEKPDIILSEKFGIGLRFIDEINRTKRSTFVRNIISLQNDISQISEEMRILYVALTRAQDYLYMVGVADNIEKTVADIHNSLSVQKDGRLNPFCVMNCNSFLKMLLSVALLHKDGKCLREFAKNDFGAVESSDICVNLVTQIDFDATQIEETHQQKEFDSARYEQICKNLEFEYKYKDLNRVFVKQSASALAHNALSQTYAFSAEPVFLKNESLTFAQKGTAMHSALELCDFENARKDFEEELARVVQSGKITDAQAKSLNKENLKKFFESEICLQATKADEVYKEKNFMVEIDVRQVHTDLGDEFDGEKIFVQGYVDLCFVDEHGVTIVDYKTDRVGKDELIIRYKTQLDIYEKALNQIFDKKVVRKAIYSLHLGEIIDL